jgi:hypothetical protein
MIDHDRLFKELLSTFFVDFLDLFLPQVANQIDRNSIQFLPQEVFTGAMPLPAARYLFSNSR